VGALDAMTPTEIGVAYRTLHVAWIRGGSVPADLPTIIALARLTEADAVHVQSLITLAGQREADGRSIRFPCLVAALEHTRRVRSSRSKAAQAAANARWGDDQPPDPGGPGLRLATLPASVDASRNASRNASRIAGVSALSESSSGARRSSDQSAKQSAQTGARKCSTREERAPGARHSAPWILDLATLSPEHADHELARRSAVYAQVHRARFPGACQDKEFLPSNVSELITLAPWVTEELAAYAIWEARKTVEEFARKQRPEAFNPIGLVIAITGTLRDHPGRVRHVSLFFHHEWQRRLEAKRRQDDVRRGVNAMFMADVRVKYGGSQ
jgi:hypothetical protein